MIVYLIDNKMNDNDHSADYFYQRLILCRCGEMADAQDSKSCESNLMSVRPRPPAPLKRPFCSSFSNRFYSKIRSLFINFSFLT